MPKSEDFNLQISLKPFKSYNAFRYTLIAPTRALTWCTRDINPPRRTHVQTVPVQQHYIFIAATHILCCAQVALHHHKA